MDANVATLFERPAPRKEDFRRDILLVHGFLGARYRDHRRVLERSVSKLAKESGVPGTVRVFRFDASATPSRGRDPLEKEAWRLRRFFNILLYNPESDDPIPFDGDNWQNHEESSYEHSYAESYDDGYEQNYEQSHGQSYGQGGAVEQRYDHVQTTYNDNAETFPHDHGPRSIQTEQPDDNVTNNNDSILFIAHGLGCWIVKDLLAHPSSGNIAFAYERTEARFLDADTSWGNWHSYREYLNRNWALFNFSKPRPPQSQVVLDSLITYLVEVDGNFDKFAAKYGAHEDAREPEERVQTVYSGRGIPIWVSERSPVPPKEATQDEIINKLLASLDVNRTETSPSTSAPAEASSRTPHDVSYVDVYPSHQGSIRSSYSPTKQRQMPLHLQARLGQPSTTMAPLTVEAVGAFNSGHAITSPHPTSPVEWAGSDDGAGWDAVTNPGTPMLFRKYVEPARQLADSYLKKGELKSAGDLFEKLLERSEAETALEKIDFRIQLAVVNMYCGQYGACLRGLARAAKDIANIPPEEGEDEDEHRQMMAEFTYLCRRWSAGCRLLAGQWDIAAREMKALLDEEKARYHVRLYRDLALVKAYLGHFDEARHYVEMAKSRAYAPQMALAGRSVQIGVLVAPKRDARDDGRSATSTRPEPQQGHELQTKEWTIRVVNATINLLAGNYPDALDASSKALHFMSATVGTKHFRTLAVAALHTWCLAFSGRYDKAEALGMTTFEATARALGRHHPQTLDAMASLVYAYCCQGRFAEAIGTAAELDELATRGPEDNKNKLAAVNARRLATATTPHGWAFPYMYDPTHHPQAIHARFQLGLSHLANGDYATAQRALDDAVTRAEAAPALGAHHPDTLRYRSEQARAALYRGAVAEARERAYPVVGRQVRLYLPAAVVISGNGKTRDSVADLCGELEHDRRPRRVDKLLQLLLERGKKSGRPSSVPPAPVILHPFLVSTLQLVANIEVCELQYQTGSGVDLASARSILTGLHQVTKTSKKVYAVLASSVAVDLATLQREENAGPDHLDQSVELLGEAHKARRDLLGDFHLDTLCAKRDYIMARCLRQLSGRGGDDALEVATVEAALDSILEALEAAIGQTHPEVLTTQLWCATIDILLRPGSDTATQERLIENLLDEHVVRERLIRSLVMRRHLVGLLSERSQVTTKLKLVDGAIGEIMRAESKGAAARENKGLMGILADLKKSFQELRMRS